MKRRCSYCDSEIEISEDVINGEIVECKDCGAVYEVSIENSQPVLKESEQMEEDWGE